MLTLYHAPKTRSSRIVWLLEELGAEYELAYMDLVRADGTGEPDPRNPHPYKKVPALDHDGALVTESSAIVLYLTDLFPEAGLGPQVGDPARGPYLTWLIYFAGVLEPVVHFVMLGIEDNPGLRATFRGRAELDAVLLGALEAHPYILGDDFSGADILLSSLGQFSREMMPAGAAVDDYLARCFARSALAAAAAKDAPPA